jgi:hypothetical protein
LTINPVSIVYSQDGSPIGSCKNSGTAFRYPSGEYGCVCGSPYNNPFGVGCGRNADTPSPFPVINTLSE